MRSFLFSNPPFPQCHASTLIRDPDGNFIAAWFAGTKEMHPDTAIWWCKQDGDFWTTPKQAAKVCNQAHWNPVLALDCQNRVIVYFKVGRFPNSWDAYKCRLEGDEWTTPRMLKSVDLECGKLAAGPVRGKIVRLSSGTLLAPSSIEKTLSYYPIYRTLWNAVIFRSTDNGKTWKWHMVPLDRNGRQKEGGLIQPSLWENEDGSVSALIRSSYGCLYRSESKDDGRNWSSANPTDIPNPNSAVDVVRLKDWIVLFLNPSVENWGKRTPISMMVSKSGTDFKLVMNIEEGFGNFSYPFAIQTGDNSLAMTYTWNRRNIAFCHISEENGSWTVKEGPKIEDLSDMSS